RIAGVAVLEGSIAKLGNQYVLGLRATNCRTGSTLAEQQGEAARKEEVLKVLSQIASKFRNSVGESLGSIRQHDTPLEDATTSSLEALKAYSAALQMKYMPAGYESQVPLFKRAIELDPNFAMAHALLGRAYGDTGNSVLSAEHTKIAFQLHNRV